jgi:hypothetical protein
MEFSMNAFRIGLAALAGLALAGPAAAQGDILKAPKIACAPESVTRCEAADKCTTRPASAKDKADILIIDFAAKKATVRRAEGAQPFADIVDEQVSGDQRTFALAQSGKADSLKLAGTLDKSGKLTLAIDGNGSKALATCTVQS